MYNKARTFLISINRVVRWYVSIKKIGKPFTAKQKIEVRII